MALLMNQFNRVTVAPGETVYVTFVYAGSTDRGPQYLSANFVGAENNYGKVTTTQTSVVSSYDDSDGYYWPIGISYAGELRNDGAFPVQITVNIGNFQ